MKEKLNTFFRSLKEDKAKAVFYILCLCGLILLVEGSFGAGMSGDEQFHLTQSEHVFNYYKTFGHDKTGAEVVDKYNLPLYGQVIDNLAYAVSRWFGIRNVMQVRHTANALCGWLAILFTALLAFRWAGKKYLPACITFFLFFFSPRFLGHSFNNLKDVDLATFMAMGLYYMTVFLQDFPKVKIGTMVMLGVSIGLAMAVRVGGLILIPYFGLFGLVRYIILRQTPDGFGKMTRSKAFGRLVLYGILISLGGYILCVLLWPYAMQAPVDHVFGSLKDMNKFAISIKQLFEGKLQWSYYLPWYYTPKWIFITIPVAVIAGALIDLVTGWKKDRAFGTAFLLFCFVFPVFWIVYTKANVYGGWRHSMFCYPTLVAMAGLGFYSLYEEFSNRWLKYAWGIVLPLVLMAGPVRHCFANHPYEYVYFNVLAGGVKKAYGQYEMDYYYHSTRKAVEWVIENADVSTLQPGEKINIATWHTYSVGYYVNLLDSAHFSTTFSRIYQMGNNDWDYAVFTVTGMNPDWITNKKAFPPVNTVHTIDVDGKPICIVLKREDKNDYYGYKAKQEGWIEDAKQYYWKALAYNPYNEQALENMTGIYLQTGEPDSALKYVSLWLQCVPSNFTALNLLFNCYYSKDEQLNALAVAKKLIKDEPGEIAGYWLAAHSYLRMDNPQAALTQLQTLVKLQDNKPAYELMAQIYASAGNIEAAQRCRNIAAQL